MSGRPAKRSWRTSAIPRPTSVASTTNAATKYRVRQSELQYSGSSKRRT